MPKSLAPAPWSGFSFGAQWLGPHPRECCGANPQPSDGLQRGSTQSRLQNVGEPLSDHVRVPLGRMRTRRPDTYPSTSSIGFSPGRTEASFFTESGAMGMALWFQTGSKISERERGRSIPVKSMSPWRIGSIRCANCWATSCWNSNSLHGH